MKLIMTAALCGVDDDWKTWFPDHVTKMRKMSPNDEHKSSVADIQLKQIRLALVSRRIVLDAQADF